MRGYRVVVTLVLSVATGGCSIHPLPENVSRTHTIEIAHSIRCEARDAYKSVLADVLIDYDNVKHKHTFNQSTVMVGHELAKKDIDLSAIKPGSILRHKLQPEAAALIDNLDRGSIGFDFTLDMKEDNNSNVTANLMDMLLPGMLAIEAKGGGDLTRQNERRFKIDDTFGNYYFKRITEKCAERVASGRERQNFFYPITGRIGLYEVIKTHTLLTDSVGLDALSEAGAELSDTLTFTTKISGSIDPTITLAPTSPNLNFTKIAPGLGGVRTDVHKVVVQLVAYKAPALKSSKAETPQKRVPVRKKPRILSVPGTVETDILPTPEESGSSDTRARVQELLLQRRFLDALSGAGGLRD